MMGVKIVEDQERLFIASVISASRNSISRSRIEIAVDDVRRASPLLVTVEIIGSLLPRARRKRDRRSLRSIAAAV